MAVRLRRSARKGDKNEGDPAAANAAGQVSPAPQADQVVPEPPVVDVGEPVSPSSDQPASLAAPVPETLVAPAPPAGTAVTPVPAFPPMPPASPVPPVAVGQPAKPAKGKGAPRPTRWALLTLAIGLATVAAAIAVVWRLPDVLTPQAVNTDSGAKVAATVTSSAPCNQANARDGVELKVNDQTINAKLDGCGHNQGEIVEVQAPTRTDGEVVVTVAGVTPGGSGLLRPLTVLLFFLSALAGAVYAFLVRWRPGRAPRAPKPPKPPKAPKAKTPRTGRKRGKKDQQPVSPLAPAAG